MCLLKDRIKSFLEKKVLETLLSPGISASALVLFGNILYFLGNCEKIHSM